MNIYENVSIKIKSRIKINQKSLKINQNQIKLIKINQNQLGRVKFDKH